MSKKEGFECIPHSLCPFPQFQGAKFNYVINGEADDWAYVRWRFRPILDDPNHPEWNLDFWKQSDWTGLIACPFSSAVDGKEAIDGIYFERGTTAYNGKMHTVMGRTGHRLLKVKGETLRSAIQTPQGQQWATKFKGYTCEMAVIPGHHPNLAQCLQDYFGDYIFQHFQTEIPK